MKKITLLLVSLLLLGNLELMAQWKVGGNNLSSNGKLGTNTNFSLIFKTNNLDRGIVTNTGKWGIGTIAPTHQLHVVGTEILSTGFRAGFMFRNRGSSTNADDWAWYSKDNVARFWRGGIGDFIGVTTAGNVGIGTVNPQSKLHITGGDLTTGWGADFYDYDPNFQAAHRKKIWLRRDWNGGGPFFGDYLMLCSSGNRSNTNQSAIMLAQGGVFLGRAKDDGAGLSREWLRIDGYGNVGIGIMNTDRTVNLTVRGGVHAREVRVTATAGADFVFEEDYQLRPLTEVAQYVKEHKHLPEIASEAEMLAKGLNMGEFQIKLLQKVEELTLYLIAQEKKQQQQEEKIQQLEAELYQFKQAAQK